MTQIILVENKDQQFSCWGKIKNIFNEELFMARLSLFLVSLDWGTDIGSGIYHFSQGNWVQGTLTLFIVFFGGLLITINAMMRKR